MTPAQRVSEWRRKNPEKAREGRRRVYHNNLERERLSRRRSGMKRNYGITLDDWLAMFDAQGRCCAACRSPDPGNNRNWHTDHCHETKVVRGILCSGCNQALGNLGESIPRIEALIRYLERHHVPA